MMGEGMMQGMGGMMSGMGLVGLLVIVLLVLAIAALTKYLLRAEGQGNCYQNRNADDDSKALSSKPSNRKTGVLRRFTHPVEQ